MRAGGGATTLISMHENVIMHPLFCVSLKANFESQGGKKERRERAAAAAAGEGGEGKGG